MGYTVHGILQTRILEWVDFSFSRRSSQPRDQTTSPTLQADSWPAEPQGKPKNTGMGSLSLLQWIVPTQESNQGLLHCRWILYQLRYQGSHWGWGSTWINFQFISLEGIISSIFPKPLGPPIWTLLSTHYSPWLCWKWVIGYLWGYTAFKVCLILVEN